MGLHAEGDLLTTQLATRFAFEGSGRMLHENDPVRTPAPRLYMAGCRHGNVVRVRYDVDAEVARAVESLASHEPALAGPDGVPVHLADYLDRGDRTKRLVGIDGHRDQPDICFG